MEAFVEEKEGAPDRYGETDTGEYLTPYYTTVIYDGESPTEELLAKCQKDANMIKYNKEDPLDCLTHMKYLSHILLIIGDKFDEAQKEKLKIGFNKIIEVSFIERPGAIFIGDENLYDHLKVNEGIGYFLLFSYLQKYYHPAYTFPACKCSAEDVKTLFAYYPRDIFDPTSERFFLTSIFAMEKFEQLIETCREIERMYNAMADEYISEVGEFKGGDNVFISKPPAAIEQIVLKKAKALGAKRVTIVGATGHAMWDF